MRISSLAAALWLLAGWPAVAQDWAKELFDHTSYDFGVVARGAKAEHRFTVKNIFLEDMHILSVISSCGCTTPQVTKNTLKTWETAEIVATLDTRSFLGHKEAALKVHFDQQFSAEVILQITCYIRGDVVVQPGAVEFGSVIQGSGAQRKVTVDYAGQDDWRIVALESANPSLAVQTAELSRGSGRVSYELRVKLKEDAPVGYIKDQVILVTSDPNTKKCRVPVPVEGVVVPGITVRPSPLLLGVLTAGQSVTKHLVVQSRTPFKVIGVQCGDPRFRFDLPDSAKTLHLIPVSFTAGDVSGNVEQKIRILTDASGGGALEVAVQVQVVAAEPATPAKEVRPVGPPRSEKEVRPAGPLESEKQSRPAGSPPPSSKESLKQTPAPTP